MTLCSLGIRKHRRQRYTIERKSLQTEVRVYFNAPKEEALVPVENNRATRKNIRNMPNVEIANWIAGQRMRQKKMTNTIVLTKKEAELQLLDDQFGTRVIEATRNITTMQQNVANAVTNNNNKEMDHPSSAPPPKEELLD